MSSSMNTTSHSSSSDEEGLFRGEEREPRRKPRQRRARLCVNAKPKIRVTQVRDVKRDLNDNNENNNFTSESDNEVFSSMSAAGKN